MIGKEIIAKLPYSEPFLFVDELTTVDLTKVEGNYTFRSDSYFYKGHFTEYPVTPGVILTECCAQIGLVCLGIFLIGNAFDQDAKVALTSTEMEFLLPVFPNEKVTVKSEKVYFRFYKLKCKVKMFNAEGQMVCHGTISGMLTNNEHGA